MADDPPTPDEEPAPPADPFDAELVAYLDGELDPAAARRVEARLASDPAAREKADALKKTFDLLDYLPRPEPSPTFATRTLERLPAAKVGSSQSHPSAPPQPQPAAAAQHTPAVPSGSVPSAQVPVAPPVRSRWALWAAGVLAASVAFAAAGYFGSAAARPYLFPAPSVKDQPTDDLTISDHRVVENLPLYAAVDDFAFAQALAGPDLFGDDPAVAIDTALKTPVVERANPPAGVFEALAKPFKALPPARQQAIRDIDRQLHALDPPNRDHLFRVLEVYAIWLDRLPEGERRVVLEAATPAARRDAIRDARERQWLDGLPAAQRARLAGLSAAEKADLVQQWKKAEADRREDWGLLRRHADTIIANQPPWPFDSAEMQKAVPEFMRAAFRTDDPARCRFRQEELTRYNLALSAAERNGGWSWYAYGRVAYELSRNPSYERYVLPEPAAGEPITTYAQLGKAEAYFGKEKGAGFKATANHVGKWPDFALAVHGYATGVKADKVPFLPPLGPARPAEFKPPLRAFVEAELPAHLTLVERAALATVEGRWPDYPREVVRFARHRDLSAPGLMLPGPPRRWDAVYAPGGTKGRP